MIPRVGQRVIGPRHRLGTIIGLGELRGEQVVYVLWDEPRYGCDNPAWHDTLRAVDVVPISGPTAGGS